MIYRKPWFIEFSEHFVKKCLQRQIRIDMIEATAKSGSLRWQGKNTVLFISKYKHGKLVLVGHPKGLNRILLSTGEWG